MKVLISAALLNLTEMTSLVYSGTNNCRAVTGWELGAPWIRSGCTSWSPGRMIRANTPWSYSMGTAPTNCPQTWLGKVSWGTAQLLSRSPSKPGLGFLWSWSWFPCGIGVGRTGKSPQKHEERGSGQEKGWKTLGSLGTAGKGWKGGNCSWDVSNSSTGKHSSQVASWERKLQVYKGFSKLLFWTSLWKERTLSHLFQQCTNRAVFP